MDGHGSGVLRHTGLTRTGQTLAQTCSKRRRWEHNPCFSFTFPPFIAQTFWAMLVSHPPCLQSTLALGASNWKRYWGWESSVSSLIPPLGEAHMVSITPTPEHWVPSLCSFSIHLTGLLFCQCTGPGPFSAVYVIKHTLPSSCPSQGPGDVISPAAVYSYLQNIP